MLHACSKVFACCRFGGLIFTILADAAAITIYLTVVSITFSLSLLTAFFRSTANRQQHVHAHDHEPITGNGRLKWWLVATIQPNNSKRANIEGPPSNVIPLLSAVTVDISSSSSNDAIQIFFFFLLLLPPPLCCDVIIVCCVLRR